MMPQLQRWRLNLKEMKKVSPGYNRVWLGEGGRRTRGRAVETPWGSHAGGQQSPGYNRVLLGEGGGCALGQSWAWEVGPVLLLGVHSKWTGSGHLQLSEAPAVFPGGFGAGS